MVAVPVASQVVGAAADPRVAVAQAAFPVAAVLAAAEPADVKLNKNKTMGVPINSVRSLTVYRKLRYQNEKIFSV